ncbi:MAG: PAS domain S-box protein [Coriobacteriia bacterium]|nr:PAS domain S-box protein [Coriobacteriia bacterium]
MRTPQGIAARVAVSYAALAGLWILVTGLVTIRLPQPLEGMVEIGKGFLFVLVTSLLLYLVIARWTQAAADAADHAEHAERELQRVVDTAPVGMLLLDGHGDVTFMNPTAEQLLGVRSTQCVGRPLEELCGAERQEAFAVSVSELLATDSIDGLELVVPGGSKVRPVIARAARLEQLNPDGGWVVAIADNTRGKEQTERFKRLLEGYRLVSEMSAVVGRSRDEMQLFGQLCHQAVEVGGFKAAWAVVRNGNTGYATAGMVGLGQAGVAVAEKMLADSENPDSMFPASLAEADVLICNDIASAQDSPWREAARDGGFGSFAAFAIVDGGRMRACTLLLAEQPGYFGVEDRRLLATLKTDLTFALDRIRLDARRVEAEEALARSEEGYRQLFDAYPQPMYVHDRRDLRILAANDAALAKYGYTREQFASMTLKELRPAAEVPQLLEHLSRKLPGLVDAGFWTHIDGNGREFPVHVLTHNIAWDGHDAELVMVQEVARM